MKSNSYLHKAGNARDKALKRLRLSEIMRDQLKAISDASPNDTKALSIYRRQENSHLPRHRENAHAKQAEYERILKLHKTGLELVASVQEREAEREAYIESDLTENFPIPLNRKIHVLICHPDDTLEFRFIFEWEGKFNPHKHKR